MVDIGSFSLHSTTTITTLLLHLAPHYGAQPLQCPSPLLRDVGLLNGGQHAGEGVTKEEHRN